MCPASTVKGLSVTSGRSGSNSRRQLVGVGLNSVYWLLSGHFVLPSSSSSSAANPVATQATQHREAKDKVASQRMVEKTFRFHRTLSNRRYEVLQRNTNYARRCIWDAVRARPSEADCRREELSDHDCRQNRNHCRTSNAR